MSKTKLPRMRRAHLVVTAALVFAFGFLAPAPAKAPELSLPIFWKQDFKGNSLKLGNVISKTNTYTEYAITYRSNGLTISGTLHRPAGKGPFPVVVLAHGYINPQVYRTGQGLSREQVYLAERGFIALHTDYRNHATSDDDPNLLRQFRLGYTEDVINAAKAARSSTLPFIDGERISLLGRSMGGGVAYTAMVSLPDLFDSAILFSAVSSKAGENYRKWLKDDPTVQADIVGRYGSPETNPAFWRSLSPYTYFKRISKPLLVFHGKADTTCPIRWTDAAVGRLRELDKEVSYYRYGGAGHAFYGNTWNKAMQRSVAFLKRTMDLR